MELNFKSKKDKKDEKGSEFGEILDGEVYRCV